MSAEAILLVHGLWTNRAVMLYLAWALARRGYRTRSVGYLSAMRSLDDNAARIASEIAALDASRVHVVGHSYGGVVSLRALERRPDARVKRVVLLGSPIGGCDAARQFVQSRWKARLLGTTQAVWREMPHLEIPAGVEAGAIAGTGRIGLGRFFAQLSSPNDGVVTVEETRHPHLADHVVLPTAHSLMIVSPLVARQVAAFLGTGRFAR
ncbi:MAG TPA: alpha/beta fold hydrolase [Burkholderiales bacterium]|nr:alpha/beta fold hydrolase [Burkholderiales bacterium]